MKRTSYLLLTLITTLLLSLPLCALASEPVNINTANIEQLQTVKGIGEQTAKKIVAYRQNHGSFSQVNDLCQIAGIGQTSLAKMSGQLCAK